MNYPVKLAGIFKGRSMDFLFDMIDVAYLERCTMEGLKRTKHHAELELHSAEFWNNDADFVFFTEYLEAVNCAISRKRYDERKTRPIINSSRIPAADVKERLDIVAVIGEYTDLRKTGNRFTGSCPLHPDLNPSLIVYPDQQSWWCYSCNKGGDIFDFIQEYDKITFPEAVSKLAGVR